MKGIYKNQDQVPKIIAQLILDSKITPGSKGFVSHKTGFDFHQSSRNLTDRIKENAKTCNSRFTN
jgi:hypothetical protein